MDAQQNGQGIDQFFRAIQALQEEVITSQRPLLVEVAAKMAAVIGQDRRIFIFGTGHSHLIAEEGFFRAGGFAPVVPILASLVMLHEHPQLNSHLERIPGIAAALLDRYHPESGEMLFIFSNSGVNQLPVEMALAAKERGLFVVSISSHPYAKLAPRSAIGKSLDEVADLAIDNRGVPGDALVPVTDSAWRVGPSSTIVGALIWNCLVTETAFGLQSAGKDLPVIASFNMPGSEGHNRALIERWRRRNPHF